jgi:hypothetical protein
MPVARAAFFATRLSPAPVLRIVRFAAFTTFFFVLDFLRLAILFPPIRYLVGPSPRLWIRVWSCRDGPGLVRLLSPVLRVVETTGSHRHTHTALAATQRVCAVTCSDCYRCDYPDAGTTSRSRRVAAPLCGARRRSDPIAVDCKSIILRIAPARRRGTKASPRQEVHGRESGSPSRLLASNRIEAQSELS